MKTKQAFIIFLATLTFSTASFAQAATAVKDYLHVPGPLMFEKKAFHLIWSAHPAADFYKQEYIVKGDTVTKFKTMILLDVITGNTNIKDVVDAKIAELKSMKANNPVVNYKLFKNKGEYMLDFVLSENTPDGKYIRIVERNVYRYKTFTGTPGRSGIILFGISTRNYGNDIDRFFANLKANRNDLVTRVGQFSIPAVLIKN